jgi:protein SCO1/2
MSRKRQLGKSASVTSSLIQVGGRSNAVKAESSHSPSRPEIRTPSTAGSPGRLIRSQAWSRLRVGRGVAPQFSLTDQNNQKVNNATYKGKVFIVEFFFSTCPTICPIMNRNLVEVQTAFKANSNFGIASISINPTNDTPEVLKKHAEFLKITAPNWHFLTGDRTYIFDLANKGFNLYAGLNPKIVGGFEHSGLFAIVDKKGNIRCRKDEFGNPNIYYDGLDKKGVRDIQEDIKILLAFKTLEKNTYLALISELLLTNSTNFPI